MKGLVGAYQQNGLGGATYLHSINLLLRRQMTDKMLSTTLNRKHSLTHCELCHKTIGVSKTVSIPKHWS